MVANLKSIRVGKTKLLAMLGSLKEREVNGEVREEYVYHSNQLL